MRVYCCAAQPLASPRTSMRTEAGLTARTQPVLRRVRSGTIIATDAERTSTRSTTSLRILRLTRRDCMILRKKTCKINILQRRRRVPPPPNIIIRARFAGLRAGRPLQTASPLTIHTKPNGAMTQTDTGTRQLACTIPLKKTTQSMT